MCVNTWVILKRLFGNKGSRHPRKIMPLGQNPEAQCHHWHLFFKRFYSDHRFPLPCTRHFRNL